MCQSIVNYKQKCTESDDSAWFLLEKLKKHVVFHNEVAPVFQAGMIRMILGSSGAPMLAAGSHYS